MAWAEAYFFFSDLMRPLGPQGFICFHLIIKQYLLIFGNQMRKSRSPFLV